jgi:hypothetical protein
VDAVAGLLSDLVAIDSINPDLVPGGAGEADIAAFVAGWLERAGLEVSVEEAAPGRPNVIARAAGSGGGREGRSLLLNAHMDIVGVEGMTDPFSPRIESGRLHGRGGYDMKGGLAAIMLAAARLAGAGLRGLEVWITVIGTSTCSMVVSPDEIRMPGITGVVQDGILPGLFGYEAGQAAVGDMLSWFVERVARDAGGHAALEAAAATLAPGRTGLLAFDWWNGNRSILADADLSGVIIGLTLHSSAEHIYRALLEAIAFGNRRIIDNFEEHGISLSEIVACGGVAVRSPLLMQLLSDEQKKQRRFVHIPMGRLGQAEEKSRLTYPNAGIEDRVHSIDDDVRRHHEERRDEHDADHHREVLHLDRLHHGEPEPGQAEDAFGDDRSAEHGREVDAELRDDGRQRAAQRVAIDDTPLTQPLGTCGPDVVLAKRLEE